MRRDLHDLELNEIAKLIQSREVSSVTVTEAALDRIGSRDGALHAFTCVTAETALAEAATAEAEIAAGRYRGPLHGVPIAIKDLFWTAGVETRGGTTVLEGFVPNEDATAVRRLQQAGVVILGKLAMTEGAYSDHHPSVRVPRNPWGVETWSGISSSGPGVALAAGLCFGALGSDTGGSIRWPSAANGVTGLKPTWGRVSRHGVLALAEHLDHIGPMARSAADIALLLRAIAGADPRDPTTLDAAVPDYPTLARQGVRGLRVGVDRDWATRDVDATTRRVMSDALDALAALGAVIVDAIFPDHADAGADWFTICAVEAAAAHEKTFPARRAEYGKALADALDAGRAIAAADYRAAMARREALRGRLDALFENIDLLATPVQPFAAPTVAAMENFVETPDLLGALARYTGVFDLSGHPTITLPGGFTPAGRPVGFQLVAPHLGEMACLRAGVAYQSKTDWHRRRPPG